MRARFPIVGLLLILTAFSLSAFTGDPTKDKGKNKSSTSVLKSVKIATGKTVGDVTEITVLTADVIVNESGNVVEILLTMPTVKKSITNAERRYDWKAVDGGSGGYIYYYMEYESVRCPTSECGDSAGNFSWPTGRCSSSPHGANPWSFIPD
jgi:hypothetical protein